MFVGSCQAADEVGSTEYIIKRVVDAPPGSTVRDRHRNPYDSPSREEHPDRLVVSLDDCVCMCSTMFRISPQHSVLDARELLRGKVVNQISVDPETKRWALVALNRMLEIK